MHRARSNLVAHAVAVPLFWAGASASLVAAARLEPLLLVPAGLALARFIHQGGERIADREARRVP